MKNGTKLPEKLVQKMIDFSSKPGDIIFDPFMGNGTTGIVAKKNFRHFAGYEINPEAYNHIQQSLKATEIGIDYTLYMKRVKTPLELSQIDSTYERAYKVFLEKRRE